MDVKQILLSQVNKTKITLSKSKKLKSQKSKMDRDTVVPKETDF